MSEFPTWPVRQRSALGFPRPNTTIERTCDCCGASFLGLAPGKTGERGLWNDWFWYCSQECHDTPRGLRRPDDGVRAVLEGRTKSTHNASGVES